LAVRLAWPAGSVAADERALAAVSTAPLGESIPSVTAADAQGHAVPASLRSGQIWPKGKLPAGERVRVRATIERASWVSWLVGGTKEGETTLGTPRARGAAHLLPPDG